MPRRREVPKRDVLPDPKFANQDVSKFVNVLMVSGKKSVAERIIYGAFEQIKAKAGNMDPLRVSAVLRVGRGEPARAEPGPDDRPEPRAAGPVLLQRLAVRAGRLSGRDLRE